jgi:guanidinoacetate N-methyltransferase
MAAEFTEDELNIGGWQVMQAWELPLMRVMAEAVTASPGDILEIGFGMGMCAAEIAKRGCRTYSTIEAHPAVAETARRWGSRQDFPVVVHEGLWEDVLPRLRKRFDGVVFDTYPLSAHERGQNHFPFIPVAPSVMKPGAIFTLYSDETLAFRPQHLQLLLMHFSEVRLLKVEDLRPPEDCEYWSSDVMVIPVARHWSA